MNKRLPFALTLSLLSIALASPALAEEGITPTTIKIGTMVALTGPLSPLFIPQVNGTKIVFDEVNAAGGIHGRKIEYIREDDECLPAKGVGAIKKLIYEHKPFIIVGGGCSNAAIAEKPEIIAAKIPWIITASTADGLTEPVNPYIYSSIPPAWTEAYGILQMAIDEKKSKIAVIVQTDAWGKARIEPLREALKKQGITPVLIEEVSPEPTDLTPTALKLKALNPDAVLMLLYPKAAVPFLRDSYKIGLTPLMIGASPLLEIDQIAKGAGGVDAVKNFRVVGASGFGTEDAEVAQWKAKIEKKYGDKLNLYHLQGIAGGQFAVEALRRAGPDPTREKILAAMSTLEAKADTYAGAFKCTPTDHQCQKTLGIFALKDGKVAGVGRTTPTR
jgi:branched-chain amino acid transport system substrate-binding protein